MGMVTESGHNPSKLPINKGGTGATTAEEARKNLGINFQYDYSDKDLTAGSSELETGKLYLVYE